MNECDRFHLNVEWSDEDKCYVGTCPELFGGGCHGDDKDQVYAELCEIVDEWLEILKREVKPLPLPTGN